MFSKETYIVRRKKLKEGFKKEKKSSLILITGNGEASMDYLDNTYDFKQDSSFRYYFGIDRADMFGLIDLDSDKDYIFGYDYTISDVIWMGSQISLKNEAINFGIENTGSYNDLKIFLDDSKKKIKSYKKKYKK